MLRSWLLLALAFLLFGGCSSSDGDSGSGSEGGGAGSDTGGANGATASNSGGAEQASSGGAVVGSTGGTVPSGGTVGIGGTAPSGGTVGIGGSPVGTGGVSGSDGSSGGAAAVSSSGSVGGDGAVDTGGSDAVGGGTVGGETATTAGSAGSVATPSTGGLASDGGSTSTGGAAVGGASGSGGDDAPPSGVDWQLDAQAPTDLSDPGFSEIAIPVQPTALWGALSKPLPTNTWWLGLALEDGTEKIAPLPYHVRATAGGLEFGFPENETQADAVFATVGTWFGMGSADTVSSRAITEYGDLSVTMTWLGAGGSMSAPIVTGMPYVTMLYDGLKPSLGFSGLSGTGDRFEVSAGGHTWVVYASEEVTFSAGTASESLDGWVRVALLTEASAAQVLDAHASAVVRRGSVELATAGQTGIVSLHFDTEGSGEPLMMALPHHVARLENVATVTEPLRFATLLGSAQAISGAVWKLDYELGAVGFTAPRAMDAAYVEEVRAALLDEANEDPATDIGVYSSGKILSRLARLVLIAEELGEASTMHTLLERLKGRVQPWLDGDNSGDNLAYDASWGGVVNGCVLSDAACDFGQGTYNDHHFHYGYHVYAAAVIAKLDATWAAEYGEKVRWLIRDYANPYLGDPYFPRFRSFDFYHGHSWAAGLTDFADGRNQESTSEAVHAYYAVQLWGEATSDPDLKNVGAILRIAESDAARTYWQIRDPSDIYDAPFSDNPCVGIVWNSKVDHATWFGSNEEYICGIQMIPVTPASEDLLDPAWVAEVWDGKLAPIAVGLATSDGWRDFLASALANWDKERGCAMIREQTGHDPGNTKTNMLHYCATRR